jgi:formate hydrogenlyase subunit 5
VTETTASIWIEPNELAVSVASALDEGRFAGLFATALEDGSTSLQAVVAVADRLRIVETSLDDGTTSYPAITPLVPAASWYEREIKDLFGIAALGHPRLDPLVLPLAPDSRPPRPGASSLSLTAMELDESPLPAHVVGEGVFTIPYGPVRSGVFESVEYLVETTGEEIPHLRTRIYHKHRGLDQRFSELATTTALMLAERVEGTASVAHAMAFSQAIETITGTKAPPKAELVRVIHAELERIASHLDSVVRHTEGAGQAVANARLSLHKERVMRLRAELCGHRFGRGVVIPGGVSHPLRLEPDKAKAAVLLLEWAIADDTRALMATPSFLDRLRGTGRISHEAAREHGALGPVGRGSGLAADVRAERPYGAHGHLSFEVAPDFGDGDALARQHVRLFEIRQSFRLVIQALDELADMPTEPFSVPVPPADGSAIGSAEAPQGELLYLVHAEHGRLLRVKPRTASFHNLALIPQAFGGDIFTDFVFIEASFGLSIAGASG